VLLDLLCSDPAAADSAGKEGFAVPDAAVAQPELPAAVRLPLLPCFAPHAQSALEAEKKEREAKARETERETRVTRVRELEEEVQVLREELLLYRERLQLLATTGSDARERRGRERGEEKEAISGGGLGSRSLSRSGGRRKERQRETTRPATTRPQTARSANSSTGL
jgi:hypothetical protein